MKESLDVGFHVNSNLDLVTEGQSAALVQFPSVSSLPARPTPRIKVILKIKTQKRRYLRMNFLFEYCLNIFCSRQLASTLIASADIQKVQPPAQWTCGWRILPASAC